MFLLFHQEPEGELEKIRRFDTCASKHRTETTPSVIQRANIERGILGLRWTLLLRIRCLAAEEENTIVCWCERGEEAQGGLIEEHGLLSMHSGGRVVQDVGHGKVVESRVRRYLGSRQGHKSNQERDDGNLVKKHNMMGGGLTWIAIWVRVRASFVYPER